jgi:glycosyltransferase involved in cell wall biosynthesis
MRVLWIESVSEMGGAQCSLLETCVALSKTGQVDVAVLTPPGPLATMLEAAGIPVFAGSRIRARRRGLGLLATAVRLFRSSSQLSRAIHAFKPDILHANGLTPFLEVMGRNCNVPAFWHVRDLRFPIAIAREASHSAEKIVAASNAIEVQLAESLSSRVFSKITTVSNGVDTERFKPSDPIPAREHFGLPVGVPVIGMVAHFVAWKRHAAFLDAAAIVKKEMPDARFVIVGRDLLGETPALAAELLRRAEKLGISDRILWIHNCGDVEKLYPALSVLVHPAVGEPFGRAVCEAMACGMPVVVASPGGPDEFIENGKNGILVGDGAAEDLATATLGLLRDPARAAEISRRATETVRAKYSISRVATELSSLYRRTLDARTQDAARGRDEDNGHGMDD